MKKWTIDNHNNFDKSEKHVLQNRHKITDCILQFSEIQENVN